MRCIFCKSDASSSTSREHIIPESLWNTKQVLPAGVVCDKCNNYFSREVEKPFLQSPAISALRFHEALPSKRGIIPPMLGLIQPDIPAACYRHTKGDLAASLVIPEECIPRVIGLREGRLILPAGGPRQRDPSSRVFWQR
jgi:hypothetical protein